MKFSRSLVYPVVIHLVCVTVVMTLAFYYISSQSAQDAFSRQIEKNHEATRSWVESHISHEVDRLTELAKVLRSSAHITDGLQAYYRHQDYRELRGTMDILFPQIDVDLFQLNDTAGKIIYQAHATTGDETDLHASLGVYEALEGTDMPLVAIGRDGWSMRIVLPVIHQNRILGAVMVGKLIDNDFISDHARSSAFPIDISLCTRLGIIATSLPEDSTLHDVKILQRTLNEKTSFFIRNDDLKKVVFYRMFPVIDQTFGLAISLDISESVRQLHLLRTKVLVASLVLCVLAVILGVFFVVRLIAPLKRMQQKTLETAEQITGRTLPPARGNEISSLAVTFDAMSEALQEHERWRGISEEALQRSESQQRMILDRLPVGLVLIESENHRIVHANSIALEMIGASEYQVIGQTCHQNICPQQRGSCPVTDLGQTVDNREVLLLTPEGDEIPILKTVVRVTINGKEHLLETFVDISDFKKLEQELREAKDKAIEGTKAKGEFLANMSHEIRTPLNSIIGMTKLALRQDMSPKVQEYLNTVQYSSKTLLEIVNNILDFSKIEAEMLKLESTDFFLCDVFENLYSLFGQRTADKDLELLAVFDRDVPHDLVGDPLRLNQVLVNLTNNAIKFTDQGEIILRVDCLKKTDKMVKLLFSVKDRGIGIGENAAKGLFSAFTQADGSTTRKYGGTGLGLAICKKLVGLMQGDIWLESTLGQGSAFYFTALFGRQDSESPVRLEMPSELHGKKILLVGSRETSLGVMQELISSFMLDVETASSGAEATRMLKESKEKENRFALILMDWHQEDRDLVTSFDRIRNDEPLSRIPLVILTALRRDDDMQMARTAGVFALLRKPVRISLLFNTLLDAFGRPDRKISFGDDSADYQESYYTEFLKGAKVLLVEDNDINRQVATELLENVGITVEAVKNGRKAVDAVFHNQYDAVLMDIQMPEMDGFEATEAIRKEKRFADLPIIAMTANVMAEDRERCLGFGMNDYVSKPVEPVALYSVLSRYVQVDKGRSSTPGPLRFDATVQENIREYDLKGIDVKAGIHRLGGNRRLFFSLLTDFAVNHSEAVDEIRDAYAAGDMKGAFRKAHTLKGMAGNISAGDLYNAALEVETALRNETLDTLEALFEETENELNSILNAMRKKDQATPPPGEEAQKEEAQKEEAPEDTSEESSEIDLDRILTALSTALKKSDPVGVRNGLKKLQTVPAHVVYNNKVEELDLLVKDYEYETALKVVDEVKRRTHDGGKNVS